MMKGLLLFILSLFLSTGCARWNMSDANPAAKIIERVMPGQSQFFKFKISDQFSSPNTFKISSENNVITILGSDQSAINAGLGHYFRHIANIHISDCGSTINIPVKWPDVKAPIEKTSPAKIRHAYNYCTHGYSYSYYTWPMWERELDRMALSGINLMLVLPGHEKVWQQTLKRFGVSDSDISKFIPGAPFTAWWLMGNMEGEGGPVPQEAIEAEADVGRRICDRLRELGVEPVVNGFTGTLPSFMPNYVKGDFIPQGGWCSYNRPPVLSPLDSSFNTIAEVWYDELHKQFGKVNYYGGDLFHEGGNAGNLDIPKCAVALQDAILKANPQGIYVMQGWGNNPRDDMLKALNKDHVLIEQLMPDLSTFGVGRYRDFHGTPWILTEANNFGGCSGMFGNLQSQSTLPERLYDKASGNIIGLGFTSEGMIQNPVVYDLWADVFWSQKNIPLNNWLEDYTIRRYGVRNADAIAAWKLLESDLYRVPHSQGGVCDFVISAIPSPTITHACCWSTNLFYWDIRKVVAAAELMVKVPSQTEGWNYDMTDLIRQILNGYSLYVRDDLVAAYEAKDIPKFKQLKQDYLEIFDDLDEMLATDTVFLLGPQFERVKSRSNDPAAQKKFISNLLQLYTTWDARPGMALSDYAGRSLTDLVKYYYKARWAYWLNECEKTLSEGKPMPKYDFKKVDAVWYKEAVEIPFKMKREGSTVKVAEKILKKYADKARACAVSSKNMTENKWNLSTANRFIQELNFDVTKDILEKGVFEATIQWKSGHNALLIEKVQLFTDGTLVCEDVHPGHTGLETKDNVYTLNVERFRDHLGTYTLKVFARGKGGNDSKGILIFKKK